MVGVVGGDSTEEQPGGAKITLRSFKAKCHRHSALTSTSVAELIDMTKYHIAVFTFTHFSTCLFVLFVK